MPSKRFVNYSQPKKLRNSQMSEDFKINNNKNKTILALFELDDNVIFFTKLENLEWINNNQNVMNMQNVNMCHESKMVISTNPFNIVYYSVWPPLAAHGSLISACYLSGQHQRKVVWHVAQHYEFYCAPWAEPLVQTEEGVQEDQQHW